MRPGAIIAIACMLAAASAHAAQWATGDGLVIELNEATGAVESVRLDDRELPLAPDALGGLCFREFTLPLEDAAQTVESFDFEGDEPTWTSANMAEWDMEETWAERRTDGAAAGDGYLRIGGHAGAGMAAPGSFDLPAGSLCTMSWRGRSRSTGQLYILCLRLFDAEGNDVTATASPPRGWLHTPYSNAHYRVDIANTKAETWESFRYDYLAPESVARARLSLRVFTGKDAEGDIDDLTVTVQPGGWSDERPVVGPVRAEGDELVQRAEPAAGLSFVTRYRNGPAGLAASVALTSDRPRCLRMVWRLPLALEGWTWEPGPISSEGIAGDSLHLAGEPFSRYLLVSVHDAQAGISMAAPPDQPALQTFRAAADGLLTRVDLGVTPEAPNARAGFSFEVARHDPAWGFRAALAHYYAAHPELGEVRSQRAGCWTLRLPDADTPNIEDFRLAFYECGGGGQRDVDFCREHGIETYRYSEPWGLRQSFPEAERREDMPPYAERLAQLREWAADTQSEQKWSGLPRAQVAQALLNSLMPGPDGRAVLVEDKYNTWATWWQLNTNPDLPQPNRAAVAYQRDITPALEWADGIYLDSVSMWHCLREDHDPAHIAVANRPLTFSVRTGKPVVLSGMTRYEFIEELYADLHARGKLLMMNLFPPATRVFGHMADVAGSETRGPQSDQEAMQQRVAAWRRPVSNLLQWQSAVRKRVPVWTPGQAREYFDNQLLYGFWPGISTAGGGTEPGYRGMHRYFRDAELLERDRPLWREYMPVFDELNAAGWEPVTHARCEPATVRVERFGTQRTIYLTVHNPGDEPAAATLSLERMWWTEALGDDIPASMRLPAGTCELAEDGAALRCDLRLEAKQTVVLMLGE